MRKYYRNFLMYNQEDQGFSTNGQPAGYIKTEVKEGKGRLFVLVQNLKDSSEGMGYRAYLMNCSENNGFPVDLGPIDVNKNKGELQILFDPDNVLDSNLAIEEFNTALIMAENKNGKGAYGYPLIAYRDKKYNWRKYLRGDVGSRHSTDYSFAETEPEKKEPNEILERQDVFSKYTGGLESIFQKHGDEASDDTITAGATVENTLPVKETEICRNSEDVNYAVVDASDKFMFEQPSDIEQNGPIVQKDSRPDEVIEADGEVGQGKRNEAAETGIPAGEEEILNEIYGPAKETGDNEQSDPTQGADSEGYKRSDKGITAGGASNGLKWNAFQGIINNGQSYKCPYLNNNICNVQSFDNAGSSKSCQGCSAIKQDQATVRQDQATIRQDQATVRQDQPADLGKLQEEFNKYFEPANPFGNRKGYYNWWKVNSPVYLNNILYQQNIKTPLLFNPSVMMAHFKYRHLIIGIYNDKLRQKEYIVGGVPGVYNIDERPFGEMCRWVQLEGYKPRYGAFGYWLVYIDTKTGKLLRVN